MSERNNNWRMTVKARDRSYDVVVDDGAFAHLRDSERPQHFLVDERVFDLYEHELLPPDSTLLLAAKERIKSISEMDWIADTFLRNNIRRDHEIVAIGGGVVQDVACFLASTLLRGVPWSFYPTTLLAQADSCIGGKSAINVGKFKNAIGTFYPPRKVTIVPHVLDTLTDVDLRSGVGEMLKVHAIAGADWFDLISGKYDRLLNDRVLLLKYIQNSLVLKRIHVEADEFDRGSRRLLNYGHTFGHAIESATDYAIPHGIAISIGMDMANYVATRLNVDNETYMRMQRVLARNYASARDVNLPFGRILDALARDKKHTDGDITLILPVDGRIIEYKTELRHVEDALCGYTRLEVPACA